MLVSTRGKGLTPEETLEQKTSHFCSKKIIQLQGAVVNPSTYDLH